MNIKDIKVCKRCSEIIKPGDPSNRKDLCLDCEFRLDDLGWTPSEYDKAIKAGV